MGKVAAADAVLLLVTLLAASGWLFSKQVLQQLPPLLFMGLRFGSAGLLLFLLGRWRGAVLPRRALRPTLGCGLLFGVSMMLWIKGLQHSSNLGVAAFICSMGVVLAPFASRLLLDTPLSRAAWLSMALAGGAWPACPCAAGAAGYTRRTGCSWPLRCALPPISVSIVTS